MGKQWTEDLAFEFLQKNETTIQAADGSNEATTRLRAIDTVLFDVIGWDKACVETERHCRQAGFVDYAFNSAGHVSLILEAKRDGILFILPGRTYDVSPVGFGLLSAESKEAADALAQAQKYAATLGSQYIAITNGHQWVFTITFVKDQPLDQRLVVVFESLDAVKRRFGSFWNCFSPDAISENRPAELLLENRRAPAPARPSAAIASYPAPADRNFIKNEIGYVLDVVWDRAAQNDNEKSFLEQCYVFPKKIEDSMNLATALVKHRRKADESVAETGAKQALPAKSITEVLQKRIPEKPIVLLGGVGHGKTTFLRYFRLIRATQELEGYIQLDVDFLDRPTKSDEVGGYAYSEIEKQLIERHSIDVNSDRFCRGVLNLDLSRFKESPKGQAYRDNPVEYKKHELAFIDEVMSDRHRYYESVFRHLRRGCGRSVAIFFDNLDRRNDQIQEQAFLLASSMARDWEALVFVCLRPGTFHRSRQSGVLDSVAPKTIVVSSPRSHLVLKKRFARAVALADGNAALETSKDDRIHFPSTADFFRACVNSSRSGGGLVQLLDAASNGSVRDLLYYTHAVLTSSHLDTRKIVDRLKRGYKIPLHEAQRALLYGDSRHYDPTRSVFSNLFDIEHCDHAEHFCRFLALHYMNSVGTQGETRGFSRTQDISDYLKQIGYSGRYIRDSLQFLYEHRCIETEIHGLPWEQVPETLRLTALGGYHINSLVFSFVYLDAIVIATPVLDTEASSRIRDVSGISDRLERGSAFLDYLDRASGYLRDASASDAWKKVHRALADDIAGIKERLSLKDP